MWKVTPSKSEMVWSMEAGGALDTVSCKRIDNHHENQTNPENLSVSTDWINTF